MNLPRTRGTGRPARRTWLVRAAAGMLLAALVGVTAVEVPSQAQSIKHAHRTGGRDKQVNFAREVDIGRGRKLYLRCAGRGAATVILESGIHDSSDVWTLSDAKPPVAGFPSVFGGVARVTRVCMYDRPGTIRYSNPPH